MKEPNKIDGNRRDLLKGLGIAAVVSLLPETGNAAQNNAAAKAAWDIPFTGEIPDTLPEGYNILLITCDQERYFRAVSLSGAGPGTPDENGYHFYQSSEHGQRLYAIALCHVHRAPYAAHPDV